VAIGSTAGRTGLGRPTLTPCCGAQDGNADQRGRCAPSQHGAYVGRSQPVLPATVGRKARTIKTILFGEHNSKTCRRQRFRGIIWQHSSKHVAQIDLEFVMWHVVGYSDAQVAARQNNPNMAARLCLAISSLSRRARAVVLIRLDFSERLSATCWVLVCQFA
jgi:hypothetical protein